MNGSFKSFNDLSFESNPGFFSVFDTQRKTSKSIFSSADQDQVNIWLQSQQISFPAELVPQKFMSGTYFCQLLNKNLKANLKYIQNPRNSKDCQLNIRKALGYLRTISDFKSNYIWSESEILEGKGKVTWPLLSDLQKYFTSKTVNIFKTGSSNRSHSNTFHKSDPHRLLRDLTEKVRPWIYSLGLSDLLVPNCDFIKDPLRNGVLLCAVLSRIDKVVEFCQSPHSIEEVYKNIQIGLDAISVKIPIKKLEFYFYTEPQEIWNLLHTLMMFYPDPPTRKKKIKQVGPYPDDLEEALKESLVGWINFIGVVCEEFQDFDQVVSAMKTGEILAKIVNKVTRKDVIGVMKNPKTPKVCVANIEKSLKLLQVDKRISQQYLRDPEKVFQGNCEFIMLLLEDIHRMHSGLPVRKRGDAYHIDGPYIVKREKKTLTPQRSYSNISRISGQKSNISYLSDFKSSPVPSETFLLKTKNTDNHNEIFSRKLVVNSKSAMDFYKPVGKCEVPNQKKKENFEGFEWIKKIEVQLPDGLDLSANVIPEMSTGEVLCRILSVVEMKDIEGVKKCNVGTPQGKRNVKLAFDVLKKKPGLSSKALFIEDKVWLGEGKEIRLTLSEIYRLYKNTIYTLIRFNRKYRGLSLM